MVTVAAACGFTCIPGVLDSDVGPRGRETPHQWMEDARQEVKPELENSLEEHHERINRRLDGILQKPLRPEMLKFLARLI